MARDVRPLLLFIGLYADSKIMGVSDLNSSILSQPGQIKWSHKTATSPGNTKDRTTYVK